MRRSWTWCGERTLRRRKRPFSSRCQTDDLAHLIIAEDEGLKGVSPPSNHITGRNVSDKFRSFARIDNNVTRSLIDRLIIGPLGQLFAAAVSKEEIVLAAVVEQQVDRFSRSIDQLKVHFQSTGVGESNHLRIDFQPHLQAVIHRTGNRTERITLVYFRQGSLRLILFTVSHERDPSVDTGRRGTACECRHRHDTDRKTKIHLDRLTDDALGCKP
jgi:hypothetical protein